jgi:hypothetical protein
MNSFCGRSVVVSLSSFYSQLFCKVSIAISRQLKDDVTSLQPFLDEESLLESILLSTIFPPPAPAENMLHIVVRLPPDRGSALSPLCMSEENTAIIADRLDKRDRDEDDVPNAVKRLKLEVRKAAPSSLGQPDRFQKIVGPGRVICCNRPFETETIPLVLLHEVFVIFKDRCRDPPSKGALACLNELAPTACVWYGKESDRRDAILNILKKWLHLEFHAEKIKGTEYITDGNLTVIVMPAALRESKNEHGDPLNLAILYYSNFLANALCSPGNFYNFNTCFPCILLVDMGTSSPPSTAHLLMVVSGSYFGFYGAIWDGDRVRVESLTPGFDLATHWKESNTREAIASSLDALVVAVRNIEDHYNQIEVEARDNPTPKPYHHHLQKARKFPFMTSYEAGGQEIRFAYDQQLDASKLLFSVFVNGDKPGECLVKFTRQYSEDAHVYLASYNSAPTLRRCVRISAEWTAVIMDRSNYVVLYGLNLTKIQQEKVRQKVEETLQLLHSAGYVHGDLRDTNILINLKSLDSDDVKVHFVDFDWAGLIGVARYPNGVNGKTVKRPEGAEDGELITIEHDKAMVSYMFI